MHNVVVPITVSDDYYIVEIGGRKQSENKNYGEILEAGLKLVLELSDIEIIVHNLTHRATL
jgi:hypothetical protein